MIVQLGLCVALGFGFAEKPCIPLCFTLSLIGGPLETTQIAFWDETHKKEAIGSAGHDGVSARMQVQFKRDAEGRLDANGTLADAKSIICVKYSDESRFSFGVAKVCRADGEIEGRRCEAFNYTGKWLHTIKSFAEKRAQEIARVKSLPGHGAPWVTGRRPDGLLFHDDSITSLKGIATAGETKLGNVMFADPVHRPRGIDTVGRFASLTDFEFGFVCQYSGVNKKTLEAARAQSLTALPGAYVVVEVDHKKAPNPYMSRYTDEWETHLDNSTFMKSHVSVKDLVLHIVRASVEVFNII